MNKRDAAIIVWAKEHRPDIANQITDALVKEDESGIAETLRILMSISFEAGRAFQCANPTEELNDPSVYLH